MKILTHFHAPRYRLTPPRSSLSSFFGSRHAVGCHVDRPVDRSRAETGSLPPSFRFVSPTRWRLSRISGRRLGHAGTRRFPPSPRDEISGAIAALMLPPLANFRVTPRAALRRRSRRRTWIRSFGVRTDTDGNFDARGVRNRSFDSRCLSLASHPRDTPRRRFINDERRDANTSAAATTRTVNLAPNVRAFQNSPSLGVHTVRLETLPDGLTCCSRRCLRRGISYRHNIHSAFRVFQATRNHHGGRDPRMCELEQSYFSSVHRHRRYTSKQREITPKFRGTSRESKTREEKSRHRGERANLPNRKPRANWTKCRVTTGRAPRDYPHPESPASGKRYVYNSEDDLKHKNHIYYPVFPFRNSRTNGFYMAFARCVILLEYVFVETRPRRVVRNDRRSNWIIRYYEYRRYLLTFSTCIFNLHYNAKRRQSYEASVQHLLSK